MVAVEASVNVVQLIQQLCELCSSEDGRAAKQAVAGIQ